MATHPNALMTSLGHTLLAVELRHGTHRSCAVAYALLIQGNVERLGFDAYWRPINEAVVARFGVAGRERIKKMAWQIHEAAAKHERQMPQPAEGVG